MKLLNKVSQTELFEIVSKTASILNQINKMEDVKKKHFQMNIIRKLWKKFNKNIMQVILRITLKQTAYYGKWHEIDSLENNKEIAKLN